MTDKREIRRLIERIQKDDEQAFEKLLKLWRPWVLAICKRFTGGRTSHAMPEATFDDLVQQCRVELWRGLRDIDLSHVTSPQGFLTKRIPLRLIDWLRSQTNRRRQRSFRFIRFSELEDIHLHLDDLESQTETDEATDETALRESLEPYVRVVSEQAKPMLVQRFVDGMSQHEIAEYWGLSDSRVSQILNRAYDKIRKRAIP